MKKLIFGMMLLFSGLVLAADGGKQVSNTGNVGVGTSTTTQNLSLSGQSAMTVGSNRNATANTAGNDLTINAGGATSGATDKNGGIIRIQPGTSTGTGMSSVRIGGATRAASTGTADNTLVDRVIVPSRKNLTDNSVVSLFDVAVANNSTVGGVIEYSIHCKDAGNEVQQHTGEVYYSAVAKAAAITANLQKATGLDVVSSGTLTDTWSVVEADGGKITLSLNADSSLTPTELWITYVIYNNSAQAITQL